MRISDWSSDVCSSDLSWGVPLCVQIRPGALVVLEIGVSHTRCGGDEIWPLAELLCDLIIEHDECLLPGLVSEGEIRLVTLVGETAPVPVHQDGALTEHGGLRAQVCRHKGKDERPQHPCREEIGRAHV